MTGTRNLLNQSLKKQHLFLPDEETTQKLRTLYLEMCTDIFSFCESHQLCCMLGGGSVLGAVRHKGFIPWDDDIDMNMPREDYDRFAVLFSQEMNDKYEVFVPDGKHQVTNLFMKVSRKNTISEDIYTDALPFSVGVSIDIFPIENVPLNPMIRNVKGRISDLFAYAAVSAYMYQNHSDAMRRLYTVSLKGKINYTLRYLLGACMSVKKYNWWYQKFNAFARCPKASSLCTVPNGRKHYFGEMREKDVFFPLKTCRFETIEVKIPNRYDIYLKQLYGNYMELPPESQREKHFYTKIKL